MDPKTLTLREGRPYKVDAVSVEADEALNSAIGDGVDYLDPAWMVRSDAYIYRWQPQSIDGLRTVTSGSGAINMLPGDGSVEIKTGATQDSDAALRIQDMFAGIATPIDWSKDISARFGVSFRESHRLYCVLGGVSFSDLTLDHIGIAMLNGDIVGTTANGTNEETETLVSSASTGKRDLKIEYDAAAGSADFYVDDMDTAKGSLSTNMPDSDSSICFLQAENPDAAENRRLTVSDLIVVIHP